MNKDTKTIERLPPEQEVTSSNLVGRTRTSLDSIPIQSSNPKQEPKEAVSTRNVADFGHQLATSETNPQSFVVESNPITEEWLKAVGFRWEQFHRQPEKQWVLWLGSALEESWTDTQDLGLEICSGGIDGTWFCWLRADTSSRYHRFIHIRHIRFQCEVAALIEALTGQKWNIENHWYGSVLSSRRAEQTRAEHNRLDKRIHREQHPWYENEKDPDRARASSPTLDAAIKGGLAS